MAKFTKLNIGDTVASGGGRKFRKLSTVKIPTEQLLQPYGVTIDGSTLTWGDYSGLATNFDILVNGVVSANTTEQSFPLGYFGFSDGTYSISVVSKAEGYLDSDPSEAVSYEVGGDSIVGTWVFNNVINQPAKTMRIDFATRFDAWGLSRNTIFTVNAGTNSAAAMSTHNGQWRDAYYFYSYSGSTNSHTKGWQYSNHSVAFPDGDYTLILDHTIEELLAWLKANATKIS